MMLKILMTTCALLMLYGSAGAATDSTDQLLTFCNKVEYEGWQLISGESSRIGPSFYDSQVVDILLSGLSSNAQLMILTVAAAEPDYRAWLQDQLTPYDSPQGLPVNSERWS